MNNLVVRNVLRFAVLIFLQIFICNYVHLLGFINPYIYIIALLLLPLSIPKSIQYLIAFLTGLIIDFFAMTYGIHASASLVVIFLRPYIISALTVGKNKETQMELPIPKQKDFKWLLTYTLILVAIHHFLITMLETFSFKRFFLTLGIILLNTIFTTFVVLSVMYIFTPAKKRGN